MFYVLPRSHLLLSGDVTQDGGEDKSRGRTGSKA